jgi:hypothetical protein
MYSLQMLDRLERLMDVVECLKAKDEQSHYMLRVCVKSAGVAGKWTYPAYLAYQALGLNPQLGSS